MIKNIIFDFGDVFINLDKEVVTRQLADVKDAVILGRLHELNAAFEIGDINGEIFLEGLQLTLPGKNRNSLLEIWNGMLLDFPERRLQFIESFAMARHFRLFLLSNTNELHIAHVMEKMGVKNYDRFRRCFEGFYLSHEIRLRKPTPEVFNYVLGQHGLLATETLFIDDTAEHIASAGKLGLKTWHLQPGKEDITELLNKL